MIYWLLLGISICCEVAGTTCMKLSQGFTKPLPSILLGVFYILCFALLTLALKKIDLSNAYAIWAGVGTALTVAVGVLAFHESFSLTKLVGVGLIIFGVILLQLGGGH